MPDVREVFDVATQRVRPDPGALERQHRGQRRRVTTRKASVYAVVTLLAIAVVAFGIRIWTADDRRKPADRNVPSVDEDVPSLEGRAPTIERLAGIWAENEPFGPWGNPILVWFSTDGTFAFEADGEFESPAVSGTYEIAGDLVTFHVGGEVCRAGDELVWRARVTDDGRLNMVITQDAPGESCGAAEGATTSFTQVSPVSPAGRAIPAQEPGPEAERLSRSSQLSGVWLGRNTGELISFSWDGTYRRDGAGLPGTEPDDQGTYRVEGGTVVFTSTEGSAVCAAGDITRWTRVRLGDGVLRASVEEDECGRVAGVVEIWVQVIDPLES
jgi:hypothetical protein